MLFLAVFCGFLAEYQLEHKIEKNREKQFMRSMMDDLAADTNSIEIVNSQRVDRLQMYDSISSAIINKTYEKDGATFYWWGRNISRRVFFFSSDGTMQQLKNSGGLRLIGKRSIADKIIEYDVLYRSISYQQQLEEVHLNEYRDVASKIFDATIFNKMTAALTNKKQDVQMHQKEATNSLVNSFFDKPDGNPQLKNKSDDLLNELSNKLNYWAAGSMRLLELLDQLYEKAVELINMIRTEYQLK